LNYFADRNREEERHLDDRFAVQTEREEQKPPDQAIYKACLLRCPIMMTTMAAMFGASCGHRRWRGTGVPWALRSSAD
jgi:hypothetical protein